MVDTAAAPQPAQANQRKLTLGVPREIADNERRVALIPDTVKRLVAQGLQVLVETDAGTNAAFVDSAYSDAGATIVPDARSVYSGADMVIKIQRPSDEELDLLRSGQILIAMLSPLVNTELAVDLARRGVTSFSMDAIPRITRAQSMDVLSSQATVAGYKAALLAAEHATKFFPMLTTAAGTIPPAKVLVLGAGVAGLQAIATARRLGAVVSAFDTRPVVKEQVESLGASFLEIEVSGGETSGGYATQLSEDQHRLEQ
ncbi:MAG TPA: NAD(P)(+) transhydrogenase (Re/Si-specific) subunit alpha, partial [Thermomicrobiales bacterium]|nr:NAD(P)(+) transhydrogenase (Re/Si-specific) subunit alpha [Thermomicrobiales bacterium]